MTYQELLELKAKRARKLEEAGELVKKKDYAGHKAFMEEHIAPLNAEIDAMELQLAEEGRFAEGDEGMMQKHMEFLLSKKDKAAGRIVDDIRGTNEYANAFAKALRQGVKVKQAWGNEDYGILTKALTETGGTPEGSDGGFLVPLDFDNMIHEMEKEYMDLSQFFRVETVRAMSGWRAVETGTRKPLPKIGEMATIGKDDQPKFARVNYSVEKYGDRLPVSSELMEDNTAGLLQYLANWFGPKYILTKNTLLLGLLANLKNPVALSAGQEAKTLRKALIKNLRTAHSMSAILLTNQNGYAEMDGWEDKNGRSLLVPNPADPEIYRLSGRRVVYGDNDLIPDEESVTPIYVGNMAAFGTLFVRRGIEIAATDIGGEAWQTDSYEIRGLCRLDAEIMDETAAFKATIAKGSSPSSGSGTSSGGTTQTQPEG